MSKRKHNDEVVHDIDDLITTTRKGIKGKDTTFSLEENGTEASTSALDDIKRIPKKKRKPLPSGFKLSGLLTIITKSSKDKKTREDISLVRTPKASIPEGVPGESRSKVRVLWGKKEYILGKTIHFDDEWTLSPNPLSHLGGVSPAGVTRN